MKKIKRISIILICLVLSVSISACAKATQTINEIAKEVSENITGFRMGEWENNVYTNEKFDLKVSLPEEWYVFNDEELASAFGEAAEKLKDSELEIEEGVVVPLFFVAENQDMNNSTININLTVARYLQAPNYDVEYTDENLELMATQMQQLGKVEISRVGQTEFTGTTAHLLTMNTVMKVTDIIQFQRIYQLYKNGYMLTFTFTALDENKIIDALEYIQFQ